MDQYAGLISVLQQHVQRFFENWNFQIVISVDVLGFVLSNEETGRHAILVRNLNSEEKYLKTKEK